MRLRLALCRIALAAIVTPTVIAAPATMHGSLPRKDAKPLEDTPGLATRYTAVTMPDGRRLRVILTRPESATARLPTLFHTQAVSCGSIEWPSDRPRNLRDIARASGYVVIRVERSGTGDSEGPGCDKLDYETEVADYRQVLARMKHDPWVDPDRIVVYGSSLGSATAPLVAKDHDVAGIVVQGGGALTYLERMIGFDRLNLDRSGAVPVGRRHAEMLRRIRFQTHYLLERKTPAQVVAEHPDLQGVWESLAGTDAKPHYGRPFAWHWQAARADVLSAWAATDAKVLVFYGEFEPFEMRYGHQVIVETVNARRPGSARLVVVPKAGHDMLIYTDEAAAYRFEGGVRDERAFVAPVVEWLRQLGGGDDT